MNEELLKEILKDLIEEVIIRLKSDLAQSDSEEVKALLIEKIVRKLRLKNRI